MPWTTHIRHNIYSDTHIIDFIFNMLPCSSDGLQHYRTWSTLLDTLRDIDIAQMQNSNMKQQQNDKNTDLQSLTLYYIPLARRSPFIYLLNLTFYSSVTICYWICHPLQVSTINFDLHVVLDLHTINSFLQSQSCTLACNT